MCREGGALRSTLMQRGKFLDLIPTTFEPITRRSCSYSQGQGLFFNLSIAKLIKANAQFLNAIIRYISQYYGMD